MSRLSGIVSDYFVVENKIASTRIVDVFKALDKFRRQSVGLVIFKAPLKPDQVPVFASRAGQLSQITEISSFGVDGAGTAFVVLPLLDGAVLGEESPELVEVERRYVAVVRLVAKLHAHNIACGDLCLQSFLLDRFGAMKIFAGWGIFEQTNHTATDDAGDWMKCVAPEQRKANECTSATDIFALGVIGYRLFTGEYPRFNESEKLTHKPHALNGSAPEWIDDVLEKALSPSPGERPQTAADLLQAITQWKENAVVRDSLPAKVETQVSSPPARTAASAVAISLHALPGSAKEKQPVVEPSGPSMVRLLKVALVIFLIGVGLWMGFEGTSVFPSKDNLGALEMRPGDVSEALLVEETQGARNEYIDQLVMSGDPLAHDILVRMFKESDSDQTALKVWDSLLTRARRSGLVRASDYVRAWGKSESSAPQRGTKSGTFLRLLDPALPTVTRIELLEALRAEDPRASIGFAAALALDLKQLDAFRPVFVSGAAASLREDPSAVSDRSVGALMLVIPEVSTLYIEDILVEPSSLHDRDVLWLLAELAKRQFPGVKRISERALAREIVPTEAKLFLEILTRKASIPARVQVSLVTCAMGRAAKAEVVSFAGWYDSDAEKVLWALVVISKDPELGARAFDALAAKPLLAPGISGLYDYVRSTYYADRALVGRIVAALALENVLPDSVFSGAFDGLNGLPKSRDLVRVVLKGPSSRAVREVIKRYNSLIDRTQLLELVGQSDPLVRAVVVEALSSANDVGILKILADSYAVETDPVVRAAYEKHISTIRERVNR